MRRGVIHLTLVLARCTVLVCSLTLVRAHPAQADAHAPQEVTARWSIPQQHLDLFITNAQGELSSSWWESGCGWQPWFTIHPESASAAPGQPVTAVWSTPQHLDLFVTDHSGRVMSTWWEGARGWQSWFAIFSDASAMRNVNNVSTELYDPARTGANLHEIQLNPAAVHSPRFGKRVQWQVEGQILAQPLYMRGVPAGTGRKNLVFVATAANLLYAFDTDSTNTGVGPVFKVRLGSSDQLSSREKPLTPSHTYTAPGSIIGLPVCQETYPPFIGVTATPVIDDAAGVMFVVNYDTAHDQHMLHALDLHRGLAEVRPPVAITAPGFNPYFGRSRPALLLMNQVVYVAFGSFICDNPQPYSGWVFGYRAVDLAQVASWRVPVANGGGIWQSGRGLVGAPDGSIYLETGNDNAVPPAPQSLANSFVKLRTSCHGTGLALDRSFTLGNNAILSIGDTDLGSSGPLLLPGGRLIGGGKQGRAYVLDASTLALTQDTSAADGFEGFQAFINTYHSDPSLPPCPTLTDQWCKSPLNLTVTLADAVTNAVNPPAPAQPVQCFYPSSCYQIDQGLGPNIHAGFVYWSGATQDGGMLYALPEKEFLRAFRYHLPAAHVDEQPAFTAKGVRASPGMPGGAISISANGNRDGVVWASIHKEDATNKVHPGRLVALDATNLNELWRDDDVPFFAKFTPPTVADGKVFLPTFAQPDATHPDGLGWLIIYGLN